jgi:hypothetical protein
MGIAKKPGDVIFVLMISVRAWLVRCLAVLAMTVIIIDS